MPASTKKPDTALSVLDKIQPHDTLTRFLQGWEPDTKRLLYGIGDGQRGVLVGSNHTLTIAEQGIVRSRLDRTTVQHWHEGNAPAINGVRLFQRISTLLTDFVYFPDARVPHLIALWIMGTYLYSMFSYYGYVFLHSTKKRSGKTRVLELIGHLAFEATAPQNAPTVAAIRDFASEGRTLQLDTLERWRGKSTEAFAAAMEFLDGGFRQRSEVSKMVPVGDGTWRRVRIPIYIPYSLAAINQNSLSDTALDRSFVIEMRRKSPQIKTRPYHYHQAEKLCEPIRALLYLWALQNAAQVASVYESKSLQKIVDALALNDRAVDIWKPIFAIARTLNLDLADLCELAQDLDTDPEVAEERRQLNILTDITSHLKDGQAVATTSQIRSWLSTPITEHELHSLLAGWKCEQKNRWIDGESRRAWKIEESNLRAVLAETGLPYIPLKKSDQSDQTLTHSNDIGPKHLATTLQGAVSLRVRDAYDDPSELSC